MKKFITFIIFIMTVLIIFILTSCNQDKSIGIIGSDDGPTSVYVSKGN